MAAFWCLSPTLLRQLFSRLCSVHISSSLLSCSSFSLTVQEAHGLTPRFLPYFAVQLYSQEMWGQ